MRVFADMSPIRHFDTPSVLDFTHTIGGEGMFLDFPAVCPVDDITS